MKPDFDGDRHFRLADASFAARVWKGNAEWLSPPCWDGDFDGDSAFRLADAAYVARVWKGNADWKNTDKAERRALQGVVSPTYGTIIGRKQKQTMQIYAYSSTSKLIDAASALSWSSVEVAFRNGEIDHVVAEHGIVPQIQADKRAVGLADLSGSLLAFPAGLAMNVTFTAGTDMNNVDIDFASDKTAIVHPNPLMHPTVTWRKGGLPVASVIGVPGPPPEAAAAAGLPSLSTVSVEIWALLAIGLAAALGVAASHLSGCLRRAQRAPKIIHVASPSVETPTAVRSV